MVAPEEPTQPTWKFTQYVYRRLVLSVEVNHYVVAPRFVLRGTVRFCEVYP